MCSDIVIEESMMIDNNEPNATERQRRKDKTEVVLLKATRMNSLQSNVLR